MSKMISVASGFQYSVNIGYDLNSDDKLKNFIPTKSALSLLEDILLSTRSSATNRSRVLVGAYGKGKSHIILTILSLLMKKNLELFEKTLPKLEENERLYQAVLNYYDSNNKILPVIISGSNTSLPQAFLLALQRTLSENDLMGIMPETNYRAATAVINRWKEQFPATYEQFKKSIDVPVAKILLDLEDFSVEAYEKFERVYPSLTAGSIFNPFLGFDVVELYSSVTKSLISKGYTGIYVVYDEFSKFLEANISEASVSDTKMLQDFAEKCNRSGEQQMHLLLISHKEIANYIDTLPKQKVDGWRGVSERFTHIHLNNNFSQTYEIIASVIQKNTDLWIPFSELYRKSFASLEHRYLTHAIFSDTSKSDIKKVIHACYPLHPISTFILPRLSERIAQNERTLFTFLSAEGVSTLPAFLSKYEDNTFDVITPDAIFDYFEPLLKKEVYSSSLHEKYILTVSILEKLQEGTLESKLVKTISLIYILEQFERLKPSKDELVGIYSISHAPEEIEAAINNLIENKYVVYLKRSNSFLKLKQTSGIDIHQKIQDAVVSQIHRITTKETLNTSNFDNYIYPARYNDEREMTRYFSFEFIEANEVAADTDWALKSECIDADGVIYAIIPDSTESIDTLMADIISSSRNVERCIFILPKRFTEIQDVVAEFNAVRTLRDISLDDKILFDEYEVVYEDLREVISAFINSYTHPEEFKSYYIHCGEDKSILRKAALTSLMSDICDVVYANTPIINNEAINRNEITPMASNSRNKIVAGLLRNELESNLGLSGTGQEVSVMRSTLLRTGVLISNDGLMSIQLQPTHPHMADMLGQIVRFISLARENAQVCFSILYEWLTAPNYHIGLRKGLIPLYLAAVFHEFKQDLIIRDRFGQVPVNTDTLVQINANPAGFHLAYLGWDPEKAVFIDHLATTFEGFIVEAERNQNSYDFIVAAMRRWYMALPKYTKEPHKSLPNNNESKRLQNFLRLLKQNIGSHELLFSKLPENFGYTERFDAGLAGDIERAKFHYDGILAKLKQALICDVKKLFVSDEKQNVIKKISLAAIIKDWCDTLDPTVFNQLFNDGTEKCLGLFATVTNDEETFVARLAKATTDLRLEDWDDSTYVSFLEKLKQYKSTAEQYENEGEISEAEVTNSYQLTFVGEDGSAITKRFEKIDYSNRGKLLYNQITGALESMGQSITEQEKRQILMEILKKLC